jgi:hypothetical protein
MSDIESARYWLSWIELGSTIALFLVVVGGRYQFVADRLAAPLRKKIEVARETEIAQLRKDAAEANLELARIKLPRMLATAQCERLTDEMRVYSGQWFSLSSVQDPEAIDLVRVIGTCLQKAMWEKLEPETDIRIGQDIGIGIGRGVRVRVAFGASQRTQMVARALASALDSKGIMSTFDLQHDIQRLEVIDLLAGTKPVK